MVQIVSSDGSVTSDKSDLRISRYLINFLTLSISSAVTCVGSYESRERERKHQENVIMLLKNNDKMVGIRETYNRVKRI